MKENKVKIYEYKILFDKKRKLKKELEEGSIDLSFRLSFFKKNTSKEYHDIVQQETIKKDQEQSELKERNKEDKKIKSLYRKITSITHPDKTSGINSKQLIETYSNFYRMAVDSYNKDENANIVMIANDLLIEVDNTLVECYIDPEIIKLQHEINKIQEMLGYQWYHVPDEMKDVYFKSVLSHFGYTFSDEEIIDVIKRPVPNRKVGTRPKSLKETRRLNGRH